MSGHGKRAARPLLQSMLLAPLLRDIPLRHLLLASFLTLAGGTLLLLGGGTWLLVRQFLWMASLTALFGHAVDGWTHATGAPVLKPPPPPVRRPWQSRPGLLLYWSFHEVLGKPVHPGAGRARGPGGLVLPTGQPLPEQARAIVDSIADSPFLFARVLDATGRPLAAAGRSGGVPAPSRSRLARLGDYLPLPYPVKSRGRCWQTLVLPIRSGAQQVGWLQVAAPWQMFDDMLNALALYLCMVGGGAVVLGCGGSLWLSRLLSHPLERLAASAREVHDGHMQTRSGLPRGRSEVLEVAAAFDGMVDRLQAALDSQRRFVADASHELKTPVAAIRGMAEALEMGAARGDTSELHRAANSIAREAERMQGLIEGLLTLSRTGAGRRAFQPLEVASVLGDVVESQHMIGLSQTLEVQCEEPVRVLGDAEGLRSVLRNLLDNAVKYTPSDGRIEVLVETDGGFATVSVQDTGCGIAPEHLPHVFERFYRADPSRSRRSGGSGLGLPIVEALVEGMGGQVEIESAPGRGTRVRVRLPLAEAAGYAN